MRDPIVIDLAGSHGGAIGEGLPLSSNTSPPCPSQPAYPASLDPNLDAGFDFLRNMATSAAYAPGMPAVGSTAPPLVSHPPTRTKNVLYKTEMCRKFSGTGYCSKSHQVHLRRLLASHRRPRARPLRRGACRAYAGLAGARNAPSLCALLIPLLGQSNLTPSVTPSWLHLSLPHRSSLL